MLRRRPLALAAALLAFGLAGSAQTADAPNPQKTMKANQPMNTRMMKPGMKKGDVAKAAEDKARKLQPMMEQEEKSMPRHKPAP